MGPKPPAGPQPSQVSATPVPQRYTVTPPSAPTAGAMGEPPSAGAAPPVEGRKVAIFIAHGMGQQIPFQTMDSIAEGLQRSGVVERSEVRTVKQGDQWLSRVEMHLHGESGPVEAHLYEGYWAPLTEGRINVRDVIRFLSGAGRNGVRNGSRSFRRWLFGNYWKYDSPIRIVLYLLVALAVVASLVAMNSTIAVVAAATALLAGSSEWLTRGLFLDLTTTFNAVVTAMAVFGGALAAGVLLRRLGVPPRIRAVWSGATALLFAGTLLVVVLAGVSLALLFYGHVKASAGADAQLWYQIFPSRTVDAFNHGFDQWARWLMVLGAVGFALVWVAKIGWGIVRDLATPKGRVQTVLVTAGMVGLLATAGLLVREFMTAPGFGGAAGGVLASGLAWPLLIAGSAYVRKLLVQYIGDVAVYVSPYKLDGYFHLREEIKSCVQRVARAVYARQRADGEGPEYEEVIVVGHSLGSVVVYDVLNRLISEDEETGRPLRVVERTPLLLTFGSPLDKTAFLFAVQGNDTTEAREALAASVQPMIRDYALRPQRWINIYSPWDPISGGLDFYDPRDSTNSRRVQNYIDPDATTLLAAHTEFWTNPLLFQLLCDQLGARAPGSPAAPRPHTAAPAQA